MLLHQDQRVHVRLPQQVLELGTLVVRIDGDENRGRFRQRHLEHHPLGHVRRQYGDLVVRLHTQRNQAFRNGVRFVAQLTVRHPKRQADLGIPVDQRFMVPAVGGLLVEHVPHRHVEQVLAERLGGPDGLGAEERHVGYFGSIPAP